MTNDTKSSSNLDRELEPKSNNQLYEKKMHTKEHENHESFWKTPSGDLSTFTKLEY